MLLALTPVMRATSTTDRPDVTACTSRSRMSREYPRGICLRCQRVNLNATRSKVPLNVKAHKISDG